MTPPLSRSPGGLSSSAADQEEKPVAAAHRSAGDFPALLGSHLPHGAARIAVIAPPGSGVTDVVASTRPDAALVAIDSEQPPQTQHVTWVTHAPFDAIVDASTEGKRRLDRLLASVYHLRAGGLYLVRQPGARLRSALATTPGPSDPEQDAPSADLTSLRSAVEVETVGKHVVLRLLDSPPMAKLREEETNDLLRQLPALGSVLTSIPSTRFSVRSTVSYSATAYRRRHYPEYTAPEAVLREYHRPLVAPGQIVVLDQVGNGVLPADTFRRNARPRLTHFYLDDTAPLFAHAPTVEASTRSAPMLEGSYFYLDNEARGHFGHALTEQVSRLWAWETAKATDPTLKALLAVNRGREIADWEYDLYAAAGIAREDIYLLREPAGVERLLSATPMFAQPDYIHPHIAQTWRRIGDHLEARATLADAPDRVFIGRRVERRGCVNATALEAIFIEHGFTVIYPEDYTLADQIYLYRHARAIGGYTGSGMFQTMFTQDSKPIIGVGSSRYLATNEYLISAVLGHDLVSIGCDPLDPNDFYSAFTFNAARDEGFLRQALSSLT